MKYFSQKNKCMNYYYLLREVYKIFLNARKHCKKINLKAHLVKITKPH